MKMLPQHKTRLTLLVKNYDVFFLPTPNSSLVASGGKLSRTFLVFLFTVESLASF